MPTTTTYPRTYLGRSGAGNRVGIYLEQRDWETRAYVGKDAALPCAIRRYWTDTLSHWDLLFFHDLGYQTVSTTTAIAAALTGNVYNNYTVHRHQFNLHIHGCAFYRDPTIDPPTTRGILNLETNTVIPWPENRSWQSIIDAPFFEFAPQVPTASPERG